MLAAPAVVRASSLMPVRTPLLLRQEWGVSVWRGGYGGVRLYTKFSSFTEALDAIDKMKVREPSIVSLQSLNGPYYDTVQWKVPVQWKAPSAGGPLATAS